MTTSTRSFNSTSDSGVLTPARPSRRRRLAAALAAAVTLGAASAAFGFSTSPGRTATSPRQTQIAIPGVRGTGGGTSSAYGVSTSPGRFELALARKAGGSNLEYL